MMEVASAMSQTQGLGDRPRFRARVYGGPAATVTGFGWAYELLDTAKPAGHQIVALVTRWTWRQAYFDALNAVLAREVHAELAARKGKSGAVIG